MRVTAWIASGLGASAALLLLGTSAANGASAAAKASPGKTASAPAVPDTGIHWEKSLDAALARAGRESKPVLVLHLFGRLDEAFC